MKVNEIITKQFIDALNENIIPWRKPWNVSSFHNAMSGRSYSGVNVLTLALLGKDEGYLTFKQAVTACGHVKSGSKGLPIVFCKSYVKEVEGKEEKLKGLALRYYSVFGLSDCILPPDFKDKGNSGKKLEWSPVEACEAVITKQGMQLEHVGSRACYVPSEHKILMPSKMVFHSVEDYYATLFHEMIHREAKELGVELSSSMESESYSKEELIAEIGSNFLASFCGIKSDVQNSKAYIQGWTRELGKNPQLIISAASQAQKRFDSILKRAGMELKLEVDL